MKKINKNSSLPVKMRRRRTIAYFLFALQAIYYIFWIISGSCDSVINSLAGYLLSIFIVVGVTLVLSAFKKPTAYINIDKKKALFGAVCIVIQFLIYSILNFLSNTEDNMLIMLSIPGYTIRSIFSVAGTALFATTLYIKE